MATLTKEELNKLIGKEILYSIKYNNEQFNDLNKLYVYSGIVSRVSDSGKYVEIKDTTMNPLDIMFWITKCLIILEVL